MNASRRHLLVTAAVFVGALGLVALPTLAVLLRAVDVVATAVGVGPPSGLAGLAVSALALFVAVEAASAVAAVRLGGFAALHRGSRGRRVGRHLALAAALFAALVVALSFLASLLRWGVARGSTWHVVAALAVLAAIGWVAVRSATAFRRGTSDADREDS